MIQGVHAWKTSFDVCFLTAATVTGLLLSAARPVESHISFGRQTFRNSTSAPIEISDEATETSHGPWNCAINSCDAEYVRPATRAAGQIGTMPRKPAKTQTTQNGITTQKGAS